MTNQRPLRFFSFSNCFAFYIRCMIYDELFFVKDRRSVSRFFFSCGYAVVLAPFVEKMVLSLLDYLCSFVKDQLTLFVWVCFWALCCVPLICLCILSLVPQSWLPSLFSESSSISPLCPFSSTVMAILSLLPLYINFRIILLLFRK